MADVRCCQQTVNKIIATIYDETLISTVINEVVGIDVLIVHGELYITSPAGTAPCSHLSRCSLSIPTHRVFPAWNAPSVTLNDEIFGVHPTIYNVPPPCPARL